MFKYTIIKVHCQRITTNKYKISCICSSCHFLHLFIRYSLSTRATILLPFLNSLFNKRALVVIALSGTTSLLIQMSNNAAAPTTHTCKHTCTQGGSLVCTCRSISLIFFPPLPLIPTFHFSYSISDL